MMRRSRTAALNTDETMLCMAAASLRFAEPPTFTGPVDAYAFRDALAGRAERVQGTAGQGSTFVDGLFIPTALAHVGATFAWATPAEVGYRPARVADGMTRKAKDAATDPTRKVAMILTCQHKPRAEPPSATPGGIPGGGPERQPLGTGSYTHRA
jgi:hypothetical protein